MRHEAWEKGNVKQEEEGLGWWLKSQAVADKVRFAVRLCRMPTALQADIPRRCVIFPNRRPIRETSAAASTNDFGLSV